MAVKKRQTVIVENNNDDLMVSEEMATGLSYSTIKSAENVIESSLVKDDGEKMEDVEELLFDKDDGKRQSEPTTETAKKDSENHLVPDVQLPDDKEELIDEEELFDEEELIEEKFSVKDPVTESTIICNEILHSIEKAPLKVSLKDMNIIPALSQVASKPFGEAGVATCVDGGRCGKRWIFSDEVKHELGIEDSVQFGFIPGSILMGKIIPEQLTSFKIKRQGAKNIVYAANLVKEVTKHFGLDFTHKTSYTFYTVEYDESCGYPIAIISL